KIAKEIQEKARAESQASFEKAKDNLAIETAKARITLRREIADLAVSVSEKVLREKLTEAKQQEKIMGLIEELEKT
ncbi:MAG: F0F1 ATP synthase subunit B, partial [Candidatus Omnitrophica bacterium]|nr:F0F1 ATP synthase subunit B [Candidatus Omnitrophota bacterium]